MQKLNTTRLAAALALTLAAGGQLNATPVGVVVTAHGTLAAAIPAASGGFISFGDLRFDPRSRVPGDVAAYRTEANGRGLRFVQFNGAIEGDWLQDLKSAGVEPLQYYPDNTFLVWSSGQASESIEAHPNVRWQGEYLPDWKVAPDLGKHTGTIRNVGVFFYNDGDVNGVLAALGHAGARVLNHGAAQADGVFQNAWVEVDADRLADLAALPQVVWLEHQSPKPILDDEISSQVLARNYSASNVPAPGYVPWLGTLGYNGNGVTWAVIDSGVDLTHPDLASRIAGGVTYPGCPAGGGPGDDNASGGHGTHVAGIIAGTAATGILDTNGFLYGQGVAPGVRIFAQNPICVGSVPWPPTGGWQVLSKDALLGGASGGNGSWTSGESGGTSYTAAARTWDQIIRDGNFDTPAAEPFIMVFSAGNSGPSAGTLTAPKAAKNPIITASTQNYRSGGAIDTISGFSSRGPTNDGRFGPTIAAPGETIASSRRVAGASQCGTAIAGTSNNYALCSGTSMASPHAAGAAALLTSWWRDNNAGATPSPAMIKALLINGAKAVGATSIPNTNYGWGRVDLPGSMGLDQLSSTYVDQTQVLTSVGQTWETTYGVPDTGRPLKVSLAWTDAAAATGANPALVNNLDLEVETGGQLYRGNVITNNASTTGGTADARNNTEGVIVPNPGGTVTVRVRATNLPGDGVPGGTATDQDFALVCRNCANEPGFTLAVTPPSLEVCAPASAQYNVNVGNILGYTTPVALSVTGQPSGTTAAFGTPSVTPPGTSTLTIANTAAASAGTSTLTITASNADRTTTLERALTIATAAPAAPTLTLPADQAVGQSTTLAFTWAASPQATAYRLEVSTSSTFATTLIDETVTGTSFTPTTALASGTTYYWRVTPDNICGDGTASAVRSFRTAVAPGQCDTDIGQVQTTVFSDDVDTGTNGWNTTGSVGTTTWTRSTARPNSGTHAWFAPNLATVSDQRLISPAIALPSNQSPLTLSFQNWRQIEQSGAAACWDGGTLEISSDGGSTFAPVPGSSIIGGGTYRGQISGQYGNPLAGLDGWCDDPARPYTTGPVIVDLGAHAGQTVQLRFRLGTDSSVSKEGWYVDDIKVNGCAILSDEIFADGFDPVIP